MRNGYLALVAEQADVNSVTIPGLDSFDADSFPVVVYQSGQTLLETLIEQSTLSLPEYIVVDLCQVGDDDLEAIRMLKADERFRAIPVLTRRLTTTRRSIYHIESPAPKPLPFIPYQ